MTKEEQDKIVIEVAQCAREVYDALGHGFQETVYKRALSTEMMLRGIEHQREFRVPLFYKCVDVGQKRVDFLVEGKIPVEVTAFVNLADVHLEQALRYMKAYNFGIGLLINFGAEGLKIRKILTKNT
ncbi:MAG: GxxExxY protein [Dysgonamonadaceae bacterium]|jgi:GxxExxY protein|nr:GxxExxY protein [Dysgonamonadaceae bacterium]